MKSVITIVLSCFCITTLAYKDGTYSCKNNYDGLPNNIYKIQTVNFANIQGSEVPYLEITRFSREIAGNKQSAIVENHISGLATRITNSSGADVLQLLALTFEFENNQLLQCEK